MVKILGGLLIGILLAMPAAAGGVYSPHNHFPGSSRSDDECHESHHLMPDGDGDCDDPRSVPEPGTLGLLALGLGGAWLARRRR